MRHQIVFCLLMLSTGYIFSQEQEVMDTLSGVISYKTSQSVYVKFQSTKDISTGDTLYLFDQGAFVPALIVKNLSSTSCVGSPITNQPLETGARIIARKKASVKQEFADIPQESIIELIQEEEAEAPPHKEDQKKKVLEKSGIKGRLSAASYINFSDQPQYDKQRMRYVFTINARRIGNTGLSAESYISFRHTLNEWQEVKDNFKRAFKIYSLSFEYDLDNGTRFWLGRKINFNISNIGAIDGLQAEKKWKNLLTGVFAGFRPDHTDYGFNSKLLQFGVYVGHTIAGKNGTIQNTFAIAEQRNHSMTDRRFAYFQHLNTTIKNLNVFTSFEFDLYTLENDLPKNTLEITSIFLSLRYKASDKLSLSGSYDARKNIIFYETYKNFIDQLLEDETRQGFRFSFNYHPWKKITLGSSAGYRFQKNNSNESKNLNTYLTFSRIPGIQVSATLSAIMIQSAYLDGTIFGIRASRDIIKGKLFGEAEFRMVQYKYKSVENPLKQSIAGANISWRIRKKTSFSLNYEAEIRNQSITNRIYTNITQRL